MEIWKTAARADGKAIHRGCKYLIVSTSHRVRTMKNIDFTDFFNVFLSDATSRASFVYGGESGIFTARFATCRPAAPLPLRLGHASAPASTGRLRLRRGPFAFESPKILQKEKQYLLVLFFFGGESGIFTVRFATCRPAAPLPLRLGHASAPASTGRLRLRRGPFGFESPGFLR